MHCLDPDRRSRSGSHPRAERVPSAGGPTGPIWDSTRRTAKGGGGMRKRTRRNPLHRRPVHLVLGTHDCDTCVLGRTRKGVVWGPRMGTRRAFAGLVTRVVDAESGAREHPEGAGGYLGFEGRSLGLKSSSLA